MSEGAIVVLVIAAVLWVAWLVVWTRKRKDKADTQTPPALEQERAPAPAPAPAQARPPPTSCQLIPDDWEGSDRMQGFDTLHVVGESHYQAALRELAGDVHGSVSIPMPGALVRDPTNRYDKNAVCVMLQGRVVGHLPRDQATRYVKSMRFIFNLDPCPDIAVVGAFIRRGGPDPDNANFGVTLLVPDMLVAALTDEV